MSTLYLIVDRPYKKGMVCEESEEFTREFVGQMGQAKVRVYKYVNGKVNKQVIDIQDGQVELEGEFAARLYKLAWSANFKQGRQAKVVNEEQVQSVMGLLG